MFGLVGVFDILHYSCNAIRSHLAHKACANALELTIRCANFASLYGCTL